ncbi:MAG: hypothetical protein HRT58_12055 [Crocinitomicaceae bacterium]|nr:hypothetical protein [Flavobacteriales bacterium]NQZ36394.1 hypothetical protein [Crocinitomicaceae bacterium]
MKKIERNLIIALLLIIYLLIVGDNFKDNTIIQNTIAIACSIIAPIIVFFVDSFLSNIRRVKLWFTSKLRYRNKKVRVSMSYIYRIHINDKYLLVKNSKWSYYQPVGGVYKILSDDIGYLKDNFDWGIDPYMKTNGEKRNDLRGTVPMPKLLNFLDWFKSQKNREISHWREFFEELIKTNILKIEDFPHFEYRYAGTLLTPIKKSKKWKDCLEILSYDVFDLIPTKEQELILMKTQSEEINEIKWLDESIILNNGVINKDEEVEIGQHAKWTIEMKHSK